MIHSIIGNLILQKIRPFLKRNRRSVSLAFGILVLTIFFIKNNSSSKTQQIPPYSEQSESVNKQSPFHIPKLIKITENISLEPTEIQQLKEQIEKDLTSFNFVESAKAAVFLNEINPDLSTISLIISSGQETKTLTRNEIHSIVNHLRGIIGNLRPENISISDDRGTSYKTDLPNQIHVTQINLENTVSELITSYFRGIIPPQHCLFRLQSSKTSEKQPEIHLDILLNSNFLKRLSSKSQEIFTKNILEKSKTLILREGALPRVSLEIMPFFSEDHDKSYHPIFARWMIISAYFITIGTFIVLAFFYIFNKKIDPPSFSKKLSDEKKDPYLKKLAFLLSKQEPKKILLILSYLDTRHAEILTSFLPEDVQTALKQEV